MVHLDGNLAIACCISPTLCSFSALAPDDVVARCTYRQRSTGRRQKPMWRDPPGGQKYYPSHNIAPTAHTPVLFSSKHYGEELEGVSERVVQPMKWGLTPSWHKGDPYKIEYETNNCRAEGMLTKRTYKVPLEKGRRCVILAEGFFEWKRDEKVKQPYYIFFPKSESSDAVVKEEKPEIKTEIKSEASPVKTEVKSEPNTIVKHEPGSADIKQEPLDVKPESETKLEPGTYSVKEETKESAIKTKDSEGENNNDCGETNGPRLLTMAGVFDVWKPSDGGEPIYSYSIITVDASPAMSWIHHRMPAILHTDEEIETWLDYKNIPLKKAVEMIRPTTGITMHKVSTVVNNSRNKTPDCVKLYDPKKPSKTAASNFMMSWLGKSKKCEASEDSSQAKKQKMS